MGKNGTHKYIRSTRFTKYVPRDWFVPTTAQLVGVAELADRKAQNNGGIGVVEITNAEAQQDLIDGWAERTLRRW